MSQVCGSLLRTKPSQPRKPGAAAEGMGQVRWRRGCTRGSYEVLPILLPSQTHTCKEVKKKELTEDPNQLQLKLGDEVARGTGTPWCLAGVHDFQKFGKKMLDSARMKQAGCAVGQNEELYSSLRKITEALKFHMYAFKNEILKRADDLQQYFLTRLIKIYLFP